MAAPANYSIIVFSAASQHPDGETFDIAETVAATKIVQKINIKRQVLNLSLFC